MLRDGLPSLGVWMVVYYSCNFHIDRYMLRDGLPSLGVWMVVYYSCNFHIDRYVEGWFALSGCVGGSLLQL